MTGHGPAAHLARARVAELQACLAGLDVDALSRWGALLAARLTSGGRLLAAGNGGSAAEAQHLTAELVGRYRHDREALSAIALHADTSSVTAIGNDYGFDEIFARQVEAHGRPGDVVILLSTSGRSRNLVTAAARARNGGMRVWSMTGPLPNPLAAASDEVLAVGSAPGHGRAGPTQTATVQEVHLVAVHILCAAVDTALGVEAYPVPAARRAAPAAELVR